MTIVDALTVVTVLFLVWAFVYMKREAEEADKRAARWEAEADRYQGWAYDLLDNITKLKREREKRRRYAAGLPPRPHRRPPSRRSQ